MWALSRGVRFPGNQLRSGQETLHAATCRLLLSVAVDITGVVYLLQQTTLGQVQPFPVALNAKPMRVTISRFRILDLIIVSYQSLNDCVISLGYLAISHQRIVQIPFPAPNIAELHIKRHGV